MSAHLGARSSYPNFDLVITEREGIYHGDGSGFRQRFWCELLVQSTDRYESPHWPHPPFLEFRTSSIPTSTTSSFLYEKHGRCTVIDFPQNSAVEYEVRFYSNFGEQRADDNLLGYYLIRRKCTFL